jgi:hypothetical protein
LRVKLCADDKHKYSSLELFLLDLQTAICAQTNNTAMRIPNAAFIDLMMSTSRLERSENRDAGNTQSKRLSRLTKKRTDEP